MEAAHDDGHSAAPEFGRNLIGTLRCVGFDTQRDQIRWLIERNSLGTIVVETDLYVGVAWRQAGKRRRREPQRQREWVEEQPRIVGGGAQEVVVVLAAADALGVEAAHCVVIGDTGADVRAAHAAGARGILVPNDRTRLEEIADAPEVAGDLDGAVDLVLGEGPRARDGLVRIEPAALADVAP
jgi:hypothetical protein